MSIPEATPTQGSGAPAPAAKVSFLNETSTRYDFFKFLLPFLITFSVWLIDMNGKQQAQAHDLITAKQKIEQFQIAKEQGIEQVAKLQADVDELKRLAIEQRQDIKTLLSRPR